VPHGAHSLAELHFIRKENDGTRPYAIGGPRSEMESFAPEIVG
jgi:hypothetical protein